MHERLFQLDYSEVQLTAGPFAEQYQTLHTHYLALDNDRLLKVYRQRAGLPAPGRDMGGWYDLDGFVPGHSLGQYISGLARFGACTGHTAAHEKVHALVEGFAATLGPENRSILRPETNLWICYTLDKHFAGLIDAATLSSVPAAPDLLNRVLTGAQPFLPARGRDRIGKKDPPYDETYVMPENLFLAAAITNSGLFSDLAHRYLLDRELFDPLARGDDPFPGQHAYSHAIALSSGARAYLVLGDTKYKSALEHAFTLLTETQQFASGGWGPNETFVTPHRGELAASLTATVDHFETPCGSYAATKLARYLMRFTAANESDTRYADNLERVLFNTILAVRPPDSDGDYPYYSTYSADATRVFYPKKWPCCSGTLAQSVADYPLNIYMRSADGICVNLYTPSRVRFSHAGSTVEIEQQTSFPADDTIAITFRQAPAASFALHLRIPSWTALPGLALNGRPLSASLAPGGYARIQRIFRSGDRLTLTLPQPFRTEAIDDKNPNTVALMRGPLQYVALNPPDGLRSARLPLPSGLKQVAPQTFIENYAGLQVVLVPLYQVGNQSYTSYFSTA